MMMEINLLSDSDKTSMKQYFKTTYFRQIWKTKKIPKEQKMLISELKIND